MNSTYAHFGVNIAEGDSFSQYAGEICRRSYENSPFVRVHDLSKGHFRGPKGWGYTNLPDGCIFDAAPDGIGTKVVLIDAGQNYTCAARDVFAMTGGDITRYGGKPLVFVNVLDVATLGTEGDATNQACRQLMKGLGDVAREQHVVCYRGETAELSVCVTSENPEANVKFNWAGCMHGVFHPDRVITGETLAAGQVVVALREYGCRSNGISAVRGALRTKFGEKWWDVEDAKPWITQASFPSTLYDKFLSDMNGWSDPEFKPRFTMHLIAHISGGGIVDKFGHDVLFRHGLSARLTDLFEVPLVLRKAVEWTGMESRETYQTFSSGNGALVVLDFSEADAFVAVAKEYGIEAQVCGHITKSKEPFLHITSGYTGEILEYQAAA